MRRCDLHSVGRPGRAPRGGFTLAELIVASVIAAMLAGAATVATQQMIRARDRARVQQLSHETVHAVTRAIARDLANVLRGGDLRNCLVRLDDSDGVDGLESDELLIFVRDVRPARPAGEQGEGDVYEVQYRLTPGDFDEGVVWRRKDPVLDVVYDGGGVVTPLATGIVSLSFEAFDGYEWVERWDSDEQGLPYALRVTVAGRIEGSQALVWSRAAAALDRVALPLTAEQREEMEQAAMGETSGPPSQQDDPGVPNPTGGEGTNMGIPTGEGGARSGGPRSGGPRSGESRGGGR